MSKPRKTETLELSENKIFYLFADIPLHSTAFHRLPSIPLHCTAFHRLHSIPLHCTAFHRLHSIDSIPFHSTALRSMIILKRAGQPGQQMAVFFPVKLTLLELSSAKQILMTKIMISKTFPIWRFSQNAVP